LYHRVGADSYAATNSGTAQFEAHIEELTSGRYSVLPLPEVVDALARGDRLPERSLAITIDDASLSPDTQAWPRPGLAALAQGWPAVHPVDRHTADRRGLSRIDELIPAA
jgi:hypothetical protein